MAGVRWALGVVVPLDFRHNPQRAKADRTNAGYNKGPTHIPLPCVEGVPLA